MFRKPKSTQWTVKYSWQKDVADLLGSSTNMPLACHCPRISLLKTIEETPEHMKGAHRLAILWSERSSLEVGRVETLEDLFPTIGRMVFPLDCYLCIVQRKTYKRLNSLNGEKNVTQTYLNEI